MRYSKLLERIGGRPPCLACHLPAEQLRKQGVTDGAFLIPSLAISLWSSPALSQSNRTALNSMLAEILRSFDAPSAESQDLCAKLKLEILALSTEDATLHELCREFFTILDEARKIAELPRGPEAQTPFPCTSSSHGD